MATGRLESIWKIHLGDLGWSERPILQYMLSLAESTRSGYNRELERCRYFCEENGVCFPPQCSATLANYLCTIADASDRPRSRLSTVIAALSSVYAHSGLMDLTKDTCINRLITALVKSSTVAPMKKSSTLPVEVITQMFMSWGSNDKLSIHNLRLKALALLALALMLRPSDVAPKATIFDHITGEEKGMIFTTDMLKFEDGVVHITLMGIKNDRNRTGFQISLPKHENSILDPVQTLADYIESTEHLRTDKGVFISLNKPHKAISAAAIAKILDKCITLAGLDGMGYSAKSFRPTGATRAIEQGIDPDIVQKMGRWKSTEVFREHYVHTRTPASFATAILNSGSDTPEFNMLQKKTEMETIPLT